MVSLKQSLSAQGAVLDILVGVSIPEERAMRQALRSVPHPVSIRALIDTGSPFTGIDLREFRSLGLLATGVKSILTASSGPGGIRCDVFDVSVTVLHPSRKPRLHLTVDRVEVYDLDLLPPQRACLR